MDETEFKKQVGIKIRQLRAIKGWSRQQLADKLDISVAGYGGIERGEVDIPITRLAQISEAFEIALPDLLGWNEKIIFNITQKDNHGYNSYHMSIPSNEMEKLVFKNELEKTQLLLQERDKENENLKQQISQLQEIITLLKQEPSNQVRSGN